jgi:hypothetical protein
MEESMDQMRAGGCQRFLYTEIRLRGHLAFSLRLLHAAHCDEET